MINEKFKILQTQEKYYGKSVETNYALFEDFTYCPVETVEEEKEWWRISPLFSGEIIHFPKLADMQKYILAGGKKLLPHSFILEEKDWGNYGSGNYHRIKEIYYNPRSILKYPSVMIEDIENSCGGSLQVEETNFHLVDEDGQLYVLIENYSRSYGGQGCETSHEITWEVKKVQHFPNPATKGMEIILNQI